MDELTNDEAGGYRGRFFPILALQISESNGMDRFADVMQSTSMGWRLVRTSAQLK